MGIFGRRNKIVDLTEDYRPQRKSRIKENTEIISPRTSNSQSQESSSGSFFGNFFGNSSSATAGEVGNTYRGNFDPETGKPLDSDEKRRRLAKRLKDMTDRIEDLSNQIYVLQQKVEMLERRNNTNRYE